MSAFTASGKGYGNFCPHNPCPWRNSSLQQAYFQQASQVYCCYQECTAVQKGKKFKLSLPIS